MVGKPLLKIGFCEGKDESFPKIKIWPNKDGEGAQKKKLRLFICCATRYTMLFINSLLFLKVMSKILSFSWTLPQYDSEVSIQFLAR